MKTNFAKDRVSADCKHCRCCAVNVLLDFDRAMFSLMLTAWQSSPRLVSHRYRNVRDVRPASMPMQDPPLCTLYGSLTGIWVPCGYARGRVLIDGRFRAKSQCRFVHISNVRSKIFKYLNILF